MDRHAYHNFQILDHIEKTPLLTNRHVAGKLNVSVKLAHDLLRKIVQKGWVHVQKRHSRRWDYFLTPKGIVEKARLTYEFMDFSMQFYREARRRSSEVLFQASKGGTKKVAFLGASELAEIAFLGIQEQKLLLVDVFDNARVGQEFLGLRVRPLTEAQSSAAEKILVTAFDPKMPMGPNYLPDGMPAADGSSRADPRLIWVFGPQPAATHAPSATETTEASRKAEDGTKAKLE